MNLTDMRSAIHWEASIPQEVLTNVHQARHLTWKHCASFRRPPVSAHHSFAAQYDRQKSVTLRKGHQSGVGESARLLLYRHYRGWWRRGDVGRRKRAANQFVSRGVEEDTLKPGDLVTVEGFRAKDGSNTANARSVVLSDGRKVFAGSSGDGDPSTSGKQ